MPTFKSDLKTQQDNPNVRQRVDAQYSNREDRAFEAIWTILGTEAVGDFIEFFDLPIGAYFLPEESRFISDGIGGTSVTFTKIGDLVDDDRYTATAIALTAAGIVAITPIGANLLDRFKVAAGSQTIRGVLGGTLPATAGKRVKLIGKYRLPG